MYHAPPPSPSSGTRCPSCGHVAFSLWLTKITQRHITCQVCGVRSHVRILHISLWGLPYTISMTLGTLFGGLLVGLILGMFSLIPSTIVFVRWASLKESLEPE